VSQTDRIDVTGERPYPVLIGRGVRDQLSSTVAGLGATTALLVHQPALADTAEHVRTALAEVGVEAHRVEIPDAEDGKNIAVAGFCWEVCGRVGLTRSDVVISLGGGAATDLAGFVAATWMRGVRVVHVPTTLLAMVDSSIGGKTGIDLARGKNMAGAFHQPDAVLADPSVLGSLPPRERSSGFAEIAKCAFLSDRDSVAQLERSALSVVAGDLGPTLGSIALAATVKAGIVAVDERESGLRELLNFGHTLGHAYETASRYRVTHGEAVSVGMVFAAALAEVLDLAPTALRDRLETLLVAAGLPVRAQLPARTWSLLLSDKKARHGSLRWILPRTIGRFSEVTDVRARSLRQAAAIVEGR
jgi:3-dehydroquinate synthase